jgi:hypothetical protein
MDNSVKRKDIVRIGKKLPTAALFASRKSNILVRKSKNKSENRETKYEMREIGRCPTKTTLSSTVPLDPQYPAAFITLKK